MELLSISNLIYFIVFLVFVIIILVTLGSLGYYTPSAAVKTAPAPVAPGSTGSADKAAADKATADKAAADKATADKAAADKATADKAAADKAAADKAAADKAAADKAVAPVAPPVALTSQKLTKTGRICSTINCVTRDSSNEDSSSYNIGTITNSGLLKSVSIKSESYANNTGGACYININITDSTTKILKYSKNFPVPKKYEPLFTASDPSPPANILIQNGDLLNVRIVGLYKGTLTQLEDINADLTLQI